MLCGVKSDWGADRIALQAVYTKVSFRLRECIAFGSAAKTILKRLDSVHYKAVRLCTGAIRTTPLSALQVEMANATGIKENPTGYEFLNLKGHSKNHPTQMKKPCWVKERGETKFWMDN